MLLEVKALGHDISHHVVGFTPSESNLLLIDGLTDEMVLEFNVFCTGMVSRMDRECNSTLIVAVNSGREGWFSAENFGEEWSEKHCFLGNSCATHVFSFC